MIADWRRKFALPSLLFLFVQLAAFHDDYSEIRAAQLAALALPHVGFATAIDLGDPTSPYDPIHPRRKQEVGRRLALTCQRLQYQMDVLPLGPAVAKVVLGGDNVSVSIAFEPPTARGLHLVGGAGCSECCFVSPIELQLSESGNWTRTDPASLVIANGTLHTRLPAGVVGTALPLGVRFDWEGFPQCVLLNGEGGPDDHKGLAAPPFKWIHLPGSRMRELQPL